MKLHELMEDDWFDDDLESGRDIENPLPVADNATLSYVFDRAEDIEDKIMDEHRRRGGKRANNIHEVGKILKQGRKEIGKVMSIPMNKIVASENMLDSNHLNALVHNDNPRQTDAEPWFIKFKDKFYAQDGNHRIAAAFLRKEPTFKALVLDIATV
jgi:hypothetical protein